MQKTRKIQHLANFQEYYFESEDNKTTPFLIESMILKDNNKNYKMKKENKFY